MNCPSCHRETLANTNLRGSNIVIDRCQACDGLWFDGGEIEKVLAVAASDLRVPRGAQPSDRACPRDGQTLYLMGYPRTSVAVAMCKTCNGLWLDRRDLAAIKTVREQLAAPGEPDPGVPETGVKAALLTFIDWAIGALGGYDED